MNETSSRTCVGKSQPARLIAGVMYWVRISCSLSDFLSNVGMGHQVDEAWSIGPCVITDCPDARC